MMKNITNDKWHDRRCSSIATTIMDTVYANRAVQARLFSEAEL